MTPSKIIRSKRKTLSLTINENAELVVRAPIRLSIEKIQDFINEKEKLESIFKIAKSAGDGSDQPLESHGIVLQKLLKMKTLN